MDLYLKSIVIFITILAFDFSHSSDNEDYNKMKEMLENINNALQFMISERLIDYSKVHKLQRRSVPEFKSVLIEAQNKLNERLMKGQRKIKKFKIHRRSDSNDDSNDYSNGVQTSESQNQHMIPVYRETISGYPAITAFNEKSPLNIFYRNDNRMKRNEPNDEDMREIAEEYDDPIPIKNNLEKPNYISKTDYNSRPDYTSNDKTANDLPNDPKSMSQFMHTIKHDGKGYHTSYFIPHIDKTTINHKQKDFNAKSNDYWKAETEPEVVKNPAKSEMVHRSPLHEYQPIRSSARPVQQIRYSANVLPKVYNAHTYRETVSPFDQPLIRSSGIIYGNPAQPSNLHNNMVLTRKPVFQNVQYRQKQHTIPLADNQQRYSRQYRRQPIYAVEESTQRPTQPTANPPVHWTKIVAELNEQKSSVNDEAHHWRPKSRQSSRQRSRDSNDNRFYKVNASLNMN